MQNRELLKTNQRRRRHPPQNRERQGSLSTCSRLLKASRCHSGQALAPPPGRALRPSLTPSRLSMVLLSLMLLSTAPPFRSCHNPARPKLPSPVTVTAAHRFT